MMSRAAGARGDVWSLGCVIWEAVTLGATPYPGVRARDVMTRVTRGLRAPHPAGASDTLYQLMLSCWMLDPDERPVRGTMIYLHHQIVSLLSMFRSRARPRTLCGSSATSAASTSASSCRRQSSGRILSVFCIY